MRRNPVFEIPTERDRSSKISTGQDDLKRKPSPSLSVPYETLQSNTAPYGTGWNWHGTIVWNGTESNNTAHVILPFINLSQVDFTHHIYVNEITGIICSSHL